MPKLSSHRNNVIIPNQLFVATLQAPYPPILGGHENRAEFILPQNWGPGGGSARSVAFASAIGRPVTEFD
jgi:hypothetical protein